MKRNRIAGFAMAAIMAIGVTACGSSSDDSSTNSVATETTSSTDIGTSEAVSEEASAEAVTVEKPDTITWWTHDGLQEGNYIDEWDAEFERLTGINLEHTVVSNNEYYELLEIAFASGTEPNVFDLTCDQKLAYYSSQGGVADLTDLIKSSGDYDKIDADIWDSISLDGKLYGLVAEKPGGIVNYVRQDWIDKLGIEYPTNYEEYIEMLRLFRDEIDQCTIPLTAPGLHYAQYLPEFYWDAEADFTYVDGQWVDGMLQDNFTGAMERLQAAYAEGLIDTEAVTNTTSACRDKWYAGEVGVFSYWYGKWADTLETRLQTNYPEASLAGFDAIEESYYRYDAFKVRAIDGRLSDEEVEQVYTYFISYLLADGGEGQTLYFCGVEGYHYEYDENGNITYLNMVTDPDTAFQSVWGTPATAIFPFSDPDTIPQLVPKAAETADTMARSGVYKKTTPSSATLNTITSDLTVIRQETIANIVMGNTSVEDGLASYRQQVEALGIQQVLDEMNAQ